MVIKSQEISKAQARKLADQQTPKSVTKQHVFHQNEANNPGHTAAQKECHDVKTQELPPKGTGWIVWFLWIQTLHVEFHDMMVFCENPWRNDKKWISRSTIWFQVQLRHCAEIWRSKLQLPSAKFCTTNFGPKCLRSVFTMQLCKAKSHVAPKKHNQIWDFKLEVTWPCLCYDKLSFLIKEIDFTWFYKVHQTSTRPKQCKTASKHPRTSGGQGEEGIKVKRDGVWRAQGAAKCFSPQTSQFQWVSDRIQHAATSPTKIANCHTQLAKVPPGPIVIPFHPQFVNNCKSQP